LEDFEKLFDGMQGEHHNARAHVKKSGGFDRDNFSPRERSPHIWTST
jgi:hypothetical protein